MHAAMLAGCAVGGDAWCREMDPLVHRAYSNPAHLPTFLQEHLLSDWALLRALMNRTVDDVVVVLHLVLLSVGGSSHEEDAPTWPEGLPNPAQNARDFSQLRTT